MVALFATLSVAAQKKTKTFTINIDSLGLMNDMEIYLEFKDSSGVTGVTYSFSNFFTMPSNTDSSVILSGYIPIKVVKAPPAKYRELLKLQVQQMDAEISRQQKINSDRINRKQDLDNKSKIKD